MTLFSRKLNLSSVRDGLVAECGSTSPVVWDAEPRGTGFRRSGYAMAALRCDSWDKQA